MAFSLSSRSLGKLEGVKPELVEVVKKAIELTKTDFGVIYGMRSAAEQQKLFDAGFKLSCLGYAMVCETFTTPIRKVRNV